MNILVAGCAGFIGSHLVDRLLLEGYSVVGIDNISSGSYSNINHLANNHLFKFSEKNVADDIHFHEYFDCVIHLASLASPKWYQKDPFGTIKANVMGSFNLCEIAKANKCPIFYSSTSEIYGNPDRNFHPQPETYLGNVNCTGPRACYDESKRLGETILCDYNRKYGLDIKIGRFFNTYGPRIDKEDGRVISNFIVAALRNTNIEIYGSGNQTRSFQYIDDLIEGIMRFIQSPYSGVMNLGNPNEFTIKELAEKIISKIGSSSQIVYKEKTQDDPDIRKPDITLAKEVLEWSPKIQLDEGLDKTIEYFKSIF